MDIVRKIRRGLKKPPRIIAERLIAECLAEGERVLSPLRARSLDERALLKKTGAASLERLWAVLAERPFPAVTSAAAVPNCDRVTPGDRRRILQQAEATLRHEVNLLGSGAVSLGARIEWYKDYKSGFDWAPSYYRSISYNNPERPSDVKFPWELSRMQWLIPAGQAYLLTGEERYAEGVRDVLDSWIEANPYACSVNWACTMEVALRIITFAWFFRVFHDSDAWRDAGFRTRFLRSLYLHADFTQRHLERSDVNGNHFTADAAGLVFAGLFWGEGVAAKRWLKLGWEILCDELPRQVHPDGVDFEASVPYHRLVQELFFLPALYRERCGLAVPESYRERVVAMARFTAAYSRRDGSVPLWGDADDARTLPLGGQPINDHRYLLGIIGSAWDVPELRQMFSGPRSEVFWLLGEELAAALPSDAASTAHLSRSFPDGGFFVMRNAQDHVFIDCGPLGLAGRGGHGHNDCLSFEASLAGEHLVSDCGSYLYTASYQERNAFRSTSYHNTPQVDGQEANRFIRWDYLWNLHNDALPLLRRWRPGTEFDLLQGGHTGYQRLTSPVTPVRTLMLDHHLHALLVRDEFEGGGRHAVVVPLHLSPSVTATVVEEGRLRLVSREKSFLLLWSDPLLWTLSIDSGRVSPSYGVVQPVTRLYWERTGTLENALTVCILPEEHATVQNLHDLYQRIAVEAGKKRDAN